MTEEYVRQRNFTESPYVKLAGAKPSICLLCAFTLRELRGALGPFQYRRSIYGSLEIVPDSPNSIHSALEGSFVLSEQSRRSFFHV